ncbi:MAG TPA: ABC transporter ATP-binding protein [Candidatus Saccharimonadales bacterium]|nr:ABC transporter ATP-binding protein [Candidatus Saccharimonadales bacterium]
MTDDKATPSKPTVAATTGRPFGRAGGGGPGHGGPMGGIGMGTGEKAKDFKGTIKNLFKYLGAYKVSLLLVLIFAISSTVFTIVGPKILGRATNQIVSDYISMKAYDTIHAELPKGIVLPPGTTGGQLMAKLPPATVAQIPADKLDLIKNLDLTKRPGINFAAIGRIILWLVGLYLISSILSYIMGWIMSSVTQKVAYKFRRDISEKINRLPLRYFDSRTYGDVLSRVTNDVDTVSQNLNQSMTQLVTSIATILGILVMMLTISWQLTLVAVVVLPISMLIIVFIIKKSQHYFIDQQNSLGEINGHIEEMYGGHNVMKAFNGEKRSVAKFSLTNGDLYNSAWKSQFFSGLLMPITSFVSALGYVGVAVLGGWLAVKGTLQIGDIQAFIQYMSSFTQPIAQTANIANVMQATAASAERVFEFLKEEEEVEETADPVSLTDVRGEVEFDNVVFGYLPGKTVIHNFTAKIKDGQRVAIVGPTGAGKTTIVNLLMRFYDVDSGSIKIDGVDIRSMRRADARKMFGMVLQDTWLFNGTLRDNIAYGKPDATDEDVREAAEAAHVDHFIHSLPGGYDMVLNEEASNISQGEKQLLTIARAMMAHTPMLILDEATSSVDTRTEILIQKAMDRLMKNKTCFIIAHRLSTIRNADLILVMRDGNIVEQGTHKELIKLGGYYASLYNSQFETAPVEATAVA